MLARSGRGAYLGGMANPPLRVAIVPVTPLQQNCSLIWCTATMRGAFVDPGGDLPKLRAAAAQHKVTIEKIILTHGHIDHCGEAKPLAEELGVSGVTLRDHERFFFDQPGNRLWCAVFSAIWDGPLTLQPEEVLQARFIPVAEVLRETAQKPYCPDSLAALKRYLGNVANVE